MKKTGLMIFSFAMLPSMVFSKSVFRSIEATSSSQNPGVVNVKSDYKLIDDEGHEKSSSQKKSFRTDDAGSYTIRLSDDGSDIFLDRVGDDFTSAFPGGDFSQDAFFSDPFFEDFYKNSVIRQKRFDDMFNKIFPQVPENSVKKDVKNENARPQNRVKQDQPQRQNKFKLDPDFSHNQPKAQKKQYTQEQKDVLKYIEQLKEEFDL